MRDGVHWAKRSNIIVPDPTFPRNVDFLTVATNSTYVYAIAGLNVYQSVVIISNNPIIRTGFYRRGQGEGDLDTIIDTIRTSIGRSSQLMALINVPGVNNNFNVIVGYQALVLHVNQTSKYGISRTMITYHNVSIGTVYNCKVATGAIESQFNLDASEQSIGIMAATSGYSILLRETMDDIVTGITMVS